MLYAIFPHGKSMYTGRYPTIALYTYQKTPSSLIKAKTPLRLGM